MKSSCAAAVFAIGLLLVSPVSAVPYLSLDYPVNTPNMTATVGRTFSLWGTALNADFVHVWGFPVTGPVFLGGVLTNVAHLQKQIDTGGFSLVVRDAPLGTYPVVIYAHDPLTGVFPTELGLLLTVQPCVNPAGVVNWPFKGPSGMVTIPLTYCGI